MIKIYLFLLLLGCANVCHANFEDWGRTGHRVTGEVATQYLSRKTKKMLSKLLNGQGLAMVSTFADDIKSDDQYSSYGPWHYVNFSFLQKYGAEPPSEKGDLVQGIQKCITVLKDPSADQSDKVFHLKMLVHFVGDLHQPLHVGRAEDKGGNAIQVQWFKKGSNLHRIWDSQLLSYYEMSYTELAENMPKRSKSEVAKLQEGTLLDWVSESKALAKDVYDSAKVGDKLGYEYAYVQLPIVLQQLQKGGVRLAKILNDLFN